MRYSVVVIGMAALAACDKSPEIHERNASVEQVANAARQAGVKSDTVLRPGQWQLKTTVEEMTIPGLPASAQADMKRMMGPRQNITVDYCMTPEDARKPGGKVFTGEESKNCRYERFDMADGKVDAVMHCQGQPSGTMTMTVHGTFSPDSYTNQVSMKATGGRQGAMTMKMRSEARRIGDCTGDEQAKVAIRGG